MTTSDKKTNKDTKSNKSKQTKLKVVTVTPGNVIYLGERSFGPGQAVTLSDIEAKKLIEQGQAKEV
jgi:hypothetical protein